MYRQEAVRYVELRLAQEMPCEAIVEGLATELGAPRDLIAEFVAQVAADFSKGGGRPAASPPSSALPATDHLPTPQGYLATLPTTPELVSWIKERLPSATLYVASPAEGANVSMRWDFSASPDPSPSKLDDPALVEFVIQQINARRSSENILQTLRERTGADREEAQRFVAQIEADNPPNMSPRKNNTFILLGVIFITGGVSMFLFVMLTVAILLGARTGTVLDQETHWEAFPQLITGAFLVGILLVYGGVMGIHKALEWRATASPRQRSFVPHVSTPTHLPSIFGDQN